MIYTLSTLPNHGVLRVYATGERITPESAAFGDAEERGWTDSRYGRTFYESRNDVEPIAEYRVVVRDGVRYLTVDATETGNSEDTEEYIEELLKLTQGTESNGDGTYYDQDTEENYETGDSYLHAIHVHVKHYGGGGWIEDDVLLER
jgi:hypothetical protein